MTQLGRPSSPGRAKYIRVPLLRDEKAALRRRAEGERRPMTQMARFIIVDHLDCDRGEPTAKEGDPRDPADRSPTGA